MDFQGCAFAANEADDGAALSLSVSRFCGLS